MCPATRLLEIARFHVSGFWKLPDFTYLIEGANENFDWKAEGAHGGRVTPAR
jgi:hypothetical protein